MALLDVTLDVTLDATLDVIWYLVTAVVFSL